MEVNSNPDGDLFVGCFWALVIYSVGAVGLSLSYLFFRMVSNA